MAYNGGALDDYYSSMTSSKYLNEGLQMLMQFNNDTNNVQFGLRSEMVQNVINARSLGIETTTGRDEWLLSISPILYRLRLEIYI